MIHHGDFGWSFSKIPAIRLAGQYAGIKEVPLFD